MAQSLLLLAAFALPLSACQNEKKKAPTGDAYKKIEKEFDDSEPAPTDRKPIVGVALDKLEKHQVPRFKALVDTLPSPCGKAHSLRTSRNNDKDCSRAPFAVEYVYELTKDGASDGEIKQLYATRFSETKLKTLSLTEETPHHGPTDASVAIVEFYDYGCPACAAMRPLLDELVQAYPRDVVLYYKQFPLDSHVDSPGAAQAALAANKQGKFKEMHDMLFSNQKAHKMADLKKYAAGIGMDMSNWQGQLDAVKPVVAQERAEGMKVDVRGTPAVFINGQLYDGPRDVKYMKLWVDEHVAGALK